VTLLILRDKLLAANVGTMTDIADNLMTITNTIPIVVLALEITTISTPTHDR
jgi:hypothetical protein